MVDDSERPGAEDSARRTRAEGHSPHLAGSSTDASLHAQLRAARTELESQVAHARAEFEVRNEKIKERTGRDLILAILIALAIGAALVLSLIFIKGLFVVFALAAAGLATFELTRAMNTARYRVDVVPQLIAGALLILAAYFFDAWVHWIAVFVAVATVIVCRLLSQMMAADGRRYSDVLTDVLVSALVQLYVPFLASVCIVLVGQENGEWWVLGFICVAVAADTGAYAAGISFGKHPMAPRISPNKTWEGFSGAVLASIGVGILVGIFLLGLPWWFGIILGITILLTATLGDLGESMIKRDLGIKDMSSWLPGHGGVLDRLDSILPSTTAALALYYLFSPMVTL
ncbi:phosphatidate cytidylyltransferase [Microbacterium sp. C7(2022)]|uniref:phosphatidate cytidylyltransferase n=1 Tax=Microbacterium sp. C7(2022) TaxID=2992759 RepID=UPI00237A6F12|nr:phosphatidate cytidylyltransferase [Microbacterium sp. C7(2022)]MDE0546919.1 phosphatidate cytidylyltransferase [Microbacterium sp. C7(2022)]